MTSGGGSRYTASWASSNEIALSSRWISRRSRMDVAHRRRHRRRRSPHRSRESCLVDRRAAQEARPVVRVLLDHLEHQRVGRPAVTHEREQQPVGVIELGAIELAVRDVGELLHVGLPESSRSMASANLFVLRLDARGVEADVLEDMQDSGSDALHAIVAGSPGFAPVCKTMAVRILPRGTCGRARYGQHEGVEPINPHARRSPPSKWSGPLRRNGTSLPDPEPHGTMVPLILGAARRTLSKCGMSGHVKGLPRSVICRSINGHLTMPGRWT